MGNSNGKDSEKSEMRHYHGKRSFEGSEMRSGKKRKTIGMKLSDIPTIYDEIRGLTTEWVFSTIEHLVTIDGYQDYDTRLKTTPDGKFIHGLLYCDFSEVPPVADRTCAKELCLVVLKEFLGFRLHSHFLVSQFIPPDLRRVIVERIRDECAAHINRPGSVLVEDDDHKDRWVERRDLYADLNMTVVHWVQNLVHWVQNLDERQQPTTPSTSDEECGKIYNLQFQGYKYVMSSFITGLVILERIQNNEQMNRDNHIKLRFIEDDQRGLVNCDIGVLH